MRKPWNKMNSRWETLIKLMDETGLSDQELALELGRWPETIASWRIPPGELGHPYIAQDFVAVLRHVLHMRNIAAGKYPNPALGHAPEPGAPEGEAEEAPKLYDIEEIAEELELGWGDAHSVLECYAKRLQTEIKVEGGWMLSPANIRTLKKMVKRSQKVKKSGKPRKPRAPRDPRKCRGKKPQPAKPAPELARCAIADIAANMQASEADATKAIVEFAEDNYIVHRLDGDSIYMDQGLIDFFLKHTKVA